MPSTSWAGPPEQLLGGAVVHRDALGIVDADRSRRHCGIEQVRQARPAWSVPSAGGIGKQAEAARPEFRSRMLRTGHGRNLHAHPHHGSAQIPPRWRRPWLSAAHQPGTEGGGSTHMLARRRPNHGCPSVAPYRPGRTALTLAGNPKAGTPSIWTFPDRCARHRKSDRHFRRGHAAGRIDATPQRLRSLARAAQHDILRRLAPPLRHDMVVHLQSLGMMAEALIARMERGAVRRRPEAARSPS